VHSLRHGPPPSYSIRMLLNAFSGWHGAASEWNQFPANRMESSVGSSANRRAVSGAGHSPSGRALVRFLNVVCHSANKQQFCGSCSCVLWPTGFADGMPVRDFIGILRGPMECTVRPGRPVSSCPSQIAYRTHVGKSVVSVVEIQSQRHWVSSWPRGCMRR